ncbi:MAG: urea carboxylase [Verrucomicrobiota bacterium JB022]|nr:urea carboxylase [Verrucomicrobiota bacterium JB022]
MFNKVLIANRGEIACRIIRTLRQLGVRSVAIYSDADAYAAHVSLADEAVRVGPAPVAESYLNVVAILEAARQTGAQAIHPGYGLLSENAAFAEACEAAGVAFIGPTPEQMRRFGLKHTAREVAQEAEVPLVPGTGVLADVQDALVQAGEIGYPVMLKSSAGGGGIGMRLCRDAKELELAYAAVERLSRNNFNDAALFLEKYLERARHIEVQIFGDGQGRVVTLGERDCSVQRRNQKVIEETPALGITESLRTALAEAARRLGESIGYRSAGTVEFIYDVGSQQFYFLEVNTRLQVEHGVTELVTGVDLVEWMVRLAAGGWEVPAQNSIRPQGHAIQTRIYAEDPLKNFQPSTGELTEAVFPEWTRVDRWVERGTEVSPYYDPMLAKVLVLAGDRAQAITRMQQALAETRLSGVETNLEFTRQIFAQLVFQEGKVHTRFLEGFTYVSRTVDVLAPGTFTTVQDYPGRVGYWDVGVPPSGPMDSLAFRLGNRILGNDKDAAGLEITLTGPTLKFQGATTICLTGAEIEATLDGEPVPHWQAVPVSAGATLALGKVKGTGCRAYLALAGGLDVPAYLGSKATFTLGKFGGHNGRTLQAGDVLHLSEQEQTEAETLPAALQPRYGDTWQVRVLYGPHGAPDFFTEGDIAMFFGTDWEVHYNSARTGVRLIGPKPKWARTDGGEAGLHPSNIHDNAYAIGAIDFTGDMPIILGPDGPSLGGFVCPATIIAADLWKIGQFRPGDKVRFVQVSHTEADRLLEAQERMLVTLQAPAAKATDNTAGDPAIITRLEPTADRRLAVTYRRSGDHAVLVEYGEMVLDLNLRFRVHALMQALQDQPLPGLLEMTPGIRSLQVRYNPLQLKLSALMDHLLALEAGLPSVTEMTLPTRIVHLPLSWDDEQTQLAIRKYDQIVRKNAPWAPSNIEFIRRINGLDSIEEVKDIVFNASYLVLGLGDVYLGAPVATPIDPRHRLVTTKYNPARTWTPENAVGIGGAYMCIYGMEGPGGYQFVGRTVQVWNRQRSTPLFASGQPWLLRFFDQIRFYPVSHDELMQMRADFPHGRFTPKVEETTFDLGDYQRFLRDNAEGIRTFKQHQQASFEAERDRWVRDGQATFEAEDGFTDGLLDDAEALPEGCELLTAQVTGNVWKIAVQPGQRIAAGDPLVVLESMKMEVGCPATQDCEVVEVRCHEGTAVQTGQALAVIRPLATA